MSSRAMTKTCSTCSHTKLMREFGVNRRSRDGRNATCVQCRGRYSGKAYSRPKPLVAWHTWANGGDAA